jgi:hypothetical protein
LWCSQRSLTPLSIVVVAGLIGIGFIIGPPGLVPLARRGHHRLRAWVWEHGSDGGDVLRSGH